MLDLDLDIVIEKYKNDLPEKKEVKEVEESALDIITGKRGGVFRMTYNRLVKNGFSSDVAEQLIVLDIIMKNPAIKKAIRKHLKAAKENNIAGMYEFLGYDILEKFIKEDDKRRYR